MLGWRILKTGEYKINLPILSAEEEQVIIALEERFKDEARKHNLKSREEIESLLKRLISSYADECKTFIDREQANYLARIAALHIYNFGFIELLLLDKSIEEISIIGVNKSAYVYVRSKGWHSVNAMFTDEQAIADVVNKMAHSIGRRITLQNPRLDAMLPNGSRLHASLPPISAGEISIRKFRERPFTPGELVDNRTISIEAMALLSLLMQGDNSILIAGNTASGKTTTLNALFSFVPANERVLITEETPEINIPHEHQVRLVANSNMGISLKDLVYDSLRMRPDRMIVGEVRNKEETAALFDVLLAGQARGAYATFHAQSAQEALQRLKGFGIDENDLRSIDYIIVQRRMLSYDPRKRMCSEIRRIVELYGNGESIYSYDLSKDGLHKKKIEHVLSSIADSMHLSKKELLEELKSREKLLAIKGDFLEVFGSIQRRLFGVRAGCGLSDAGSGAIHGTR